MGSLQVMITKEETALVQRIARQVYASYCPAGESGMVTLEELSHYGIIGLLESKSKFDRSKNVPWLTFVAFRIRGAMLDQIRKLPIFRIPHEKQAKIKDVQRAKMELQKSGKNADPEELAKMLG